MNLVNFVKIKINARLSYFNEFNQPVELEGEIITAVKIPGGYDALLPHTTFFVSEHHAEVLETRIVDVFAEEEKSHEEIQSPRSTKSSFIKEMFGDGLASIKVEYK